MDPSAGHGNFAAVSPCEGVTFRPQVRLSEGTGRERAVPSRVGQTGARTDREIGVQTLRGGDVVGEHTVYLVSQGERIELTHRAWDRDTFVRGGLRAARWATEQAPGQYTMKDVLGL